MTATSTSRPASGWSPTRVVLTTIEDGAASLHEIATRSGLDIGIVSMAIERLVASGHLTSERLLTGCPDGGCGSCPSGRDGRPGCGAPAGGRPSAGPVLLSVGPVRR